MRQYEINLLKKFNTSARSNKGEETLDIYYEQVGFFRLDVYHVTKFNIYDSTETSPNWGKYGGLNDRLFYGNRTNAEIWSKRFDFADDFEKIYMNKKTSCDGYHSEYYLGSLLHHHNVSVEEKPICLWRIRAKKTLSILDCEQLENFRNVTMLLEMAPPGYRAGT